MRLQGLHHITMITADAQRNVSFYADLLGLRLVKKTVNFDKPDAYHLYFGDEQGSPGSLLTWFEFPDAAQGRAGAGMVHLIQVAVGGESSLEFWERRLRAGGVETERGEGSLGFRDYDGLAFEIVAAGGGDPGLLPRHPEIPREHALIRLSGARAYAPAAPHPHAAALLGETLGFTSESDGYGVEGERAHFHWAYDPAPDAPGLQGAGTVHHIAWASRDEDHADWHTRVADAGAHVTEIIDREYFESIYFREGNGVLFEIATLSPGFAVDEPPEHLGESLRLPARYESLRGALEEVLTPLVNPRTKQREGAGA